MRASQPCASFLPSIPVLSPKGPHRYMVCCQGPKGFPYSYLRIYLRSGLSIYYAATRTVWEVYPLLRLKALMFRVYKFRFRVEGPMITSPVCRSHWSRRTTLFLRLRTGLEHRNPQSLNLKGYCLRHTEIVQGHLQSDFRVPCEVYMGNE